MYFVLARAVAKSAVMAASTANEEGPSQMGTNLHLHLHRHSSMLLAIRQIPLRQLTRTFHMH